MNKTPANHRDIFRHRRNAKTKKGESDVLLAKADNLETPDRV